MIDDGGHTGLMVDYAVIVLFSMGALLLFLYCFWKGRLDFDEGPKYQMLEEEDLHEQGK